MDDPGYCEQLFESYSKIYNENQNWVSWEDLKYTGRDISMWNFERQIRKVEKKHKFIEDQAKADQSFRELMDELNTDENLIFQRLIEYERKNQKEK